MRGLSSMATRALLAELAGQAGVLGVASVTFESGGGVEMARRVREGEVADVVVLARGAIAELADEGHVLRASVRPLFVSDTVVAAPDGANAPDVSSPEALRAALRGARRIGYSTGPSGDALVALVAQWGLTDELADRWVQARPGVPVASLLAQGRADLGFQQRSELAGSTGVRVLGTMPRGCEITTVFSGAVCTASGHPGESATVLDHLASDAVLAVVRRHGMSPAPGAAGP